MDGSGSGLGVGGFGDFGDDPSRDGATKEQRGEMALERGRFGLVRGE